VIGVWNAPWYCASDVVDAVRIGDGNQHTGESAA
jgi:hypothetical protein